MFVENISRRQISRWRFLTEEITNHTTFNLTRTSIDRQFARSEGSDEEGDDGGSELMANVIWTDISSIV